jgi:hypothetical protein
VGEELSQHLWVSADGPNVDRLVVLSGSSAIVLSGRVLDGAFNDEEGPLEDEVVLLGARGDELELGAVLVRLDVLLMALKVAPS